MSSLRECSRVNEQPGEGEPVKVRFRVQAVA
jgi:hypothetical protein